MDEELVHRVILVAFFLSVDQILVSVDILLDILAVATDSELAFLTVGVGAINLVFMFLVGNEFSHTREFGAALGRAWLNEKHERNTEDDEDDKELRNSFLGREQVNLN